MPLVHVYLDGEVEKRDDFTTMPTRDGNSYQISGVKLLQNGAGRWYTLLHDLKDPVPAVVAEVVEEISFYVRLPLLPYRERGIYCHESAEAEVLDGLDAGDQVIQIRLRGEKIEDLRELLRLIRTGVIRPEESYEGKQNGMSRQELEAELRRVRGKLEEISSDRQAYAAGLRKFADDLSGGWPLCTRRRVVAAIDHILSS